MQQKLPNAKKSQIFPGWAETKVSAVWAITTNKHEEDWGEVELNHNF